MKHIIRTCFSLCFLACFATLSFVGCTTTEEEKTYIDDFKGPFPEDENLISMPDVISKAIGRVYPSIFQSDVILGGGSAAADYAKSDMVVGDPSLFKLVYEDGAFTDASLANARILKSGVTAINPKTLFIAKADITLSDVVDDQEGCISLVGAYLKSAILDGVYLSEWDNTDEASEFVAALRSTYGYDFVMIAQSVDNIALDKCQKYINGQYFNLDVDASADDYNAVYECLAWAEVNLMSPHINLMEFSGDDSESLVDIALYFTLSASDAYVLYTSPANKWYASYENTELVDGVITSILGSTNGLASVDENGIRIKPYQNASVYYNSKGEAAKSISLDDNELYSYYSLTKQSSLTSIDLGENDGDYIVVSEYVEPQELCGIEMLVNGSFAEYDFATSTAPAIVEQVGYELGGMRSSGGWFYYGAEQGATIEQAGSPFESGAAAKIVVNTQKSESTDLSLHQFVSCAEGAKYRIKFKVSSSSAGEMTYALSPAYELPGAGAFPEIPTMPDDIFAETLSFEASEVKEINVVTEAAPFGSGVFKLVFNYGTMPSGTEIWIDEVELYETAGFDGDPLSSGNLCAGDFSENRPNSFTSYTSENFVNGFMLKWSAGYNKEIVDDGGNKVLKLATIDPKSAFWDSNLEYDFIPVVGTTYEVSFRAKATVDFGIALRLGVSDHDRSVLYLYDLQPTAMWLDTDISLGGASGAGIPITSDWISYSYTCQNPANISGVVYSLDIQLGKMPAGCEFYIDDVEIKAVVE